MPGDLVRCRHLLVDFEPLRFDAALALAGPPALWIALGAVMCVVGAVALLFVRSGASRRALDLADNPPAPEDLARISPMTQAVAALALLAVGYHLIMHALRAAAMVAPLPWVIGVAAGVCALSLLTDLIEFRSLRASASQKDNPP